MTKNLKISVEQLQVGTFITLPVSWKDHPFLFSSFKIKDAAQIELIKHLGITEVLFNQEKSEVQPLALDAIESDSVDLDADPEDSSDDMMLLKNEMEVEKQDSIDKQQQMRRSINKTEKQFNRSVAMMRSVTSKLGSRPLNAVNDAKDLISNLTEQLLSGDNLVLHLMGDAKPEEGIHHHSLNVSTLCMLLGKGLGWEKEDLEIIGMGALFHDMGKLKIPTNILNKRTPLSPPEINFIKQHPLMSINFLKLADNFPEAAKPLIANHHEFLDGSGSPLGLKADKLDKFSQLIAVVNEYDNLCNGSLQSKSKTPFAALSYLYKNYSTKLNKEYVGRMIKTLGIYPPGCIIELSSGQFGIVMSVNLNKILFPMIMVYDPSVPKDLAPIIDLEKEGISIVRCLPASALPEKIFKYLNPRENVSYSFSNDS
jgi:HD-GYP domain-containing protein (c-di-GMP phosphodiesterase class II)